MPPEVSEDPVPSPGSRRSPWRLVPIVLVGVLVIGTAVYYYSEIQSILQLQTWDKSGPRGALSDFGDALEAGDVAGLENVCINAQDIQTAEDGSIVSLKRGGGAPGSPIPPSAVIPADPVDSIPVEYDLRPNRRHAVLKYTSQAGTPASVLVSRHAGQWQIKSYSGRP